MRGTDCKRLHLMMGSPFLQGFPRKSGWNFLGPIHSVFIPVGEVIHRLVHHGDGRGAELPHGEVLPRLVPHWVHPRLT